MKLDELVGIYVKLRDRRSMRKAAYEADDEKDKAAQEKIEAKLLTLFNELGTESVRTDAGTAYKVVKTYTSIGDWDATLSHIQKHKLWHLLHRAVSKKEVEAYIAEHEAPPPGVNVRQVAEVNIRRT